MKAKFIKWVMGEIESFSQFIELKNKLKIEFVKAPKLNECIANEDAAKNVICFNLSFFEKLDNGFSIIIILHEIYHFAKQGITSKQQVAELRYDYLWPFMQIFDIEADLAVVEYHKHKDQSYSFEKYLLILHGGSLVFSNSGIRRVKLERFIGSLVSIKQFFHTNQHKTFLPTLSINSLTLISVHFDQKHFRLDNYELLNSNIEDWKMAFQLANEMTLEDYIDLINNLTDNFRLLSSPSL